MITPLSKKEQLKYINKAIKEKNNLSKECMKLWQYIVKLRANYKCEFPGCRVSYTKLDAHHYYSKGAYPNLKYDIMNGICLCAKHHSPGFGKESAHSDPEFKDKILGRIPGYKAIRTESWAKIMNYRANVETKQTNLNLEHLYLINELKKYKEKIIEFRDLIEDDLIKEYKL